jgi:uncharacterized membrane protein
MKHVLIALLLGSLTLVGCTTPSTDEVILDDAIIQQEADPILEEEEIEAGLFDLMTINISSNGTEPFWNFSASGSSLIWNEASMAGPMTSTPYTITMTQTPTTVIINGIGFNALLTLQTCSDGMSDIVYGYEAVITKGSDTFNGCANITP